MKILVTGADGFIGTELCRTLLKLNFSLHVAVRKCRQSDFGAARVFEIGDIGSAPDWGPALSGVDTVIHLAGLAHVPSQTKQRWLSYLKKVNVLGTEHLARQAARAGVKRFIFISSVKVNGRGIDRPYTEKDIPSPSDAYGASKLEAEEALAAVAAETGLKTVILRPSLIYGCGVKSNFKNLVKMSGWGLPLPFKGVNNCRSFLYLGNLVDAIVVCINHPQAAGEVFLISDGQDISTSDLIKMIAKAMNKKVFLFSLPAGILKMLSRLVGNAEYLEKITESFFVNSNKIRDLLGWKPPFTLEEGIRKTVKTLRI